MNWKLDIHDIQILTDLNTALSKFTDSLQVESILIQIEIKQSREEIINRCNHWQHEVDSAQNQVALCEAKLHHCLNSGYSDQDGHYHPPDCSCEQRSLEQAEHYLKECRENLNTAKLWLNRIDQAIHEFQKTYARLSFLEAHSERAGSFLEETSSKYEEVQAVEHAVGAIQTIAGIQDGEAVPSNYPLSDEQQIGYASVALNEIAAIQTENWATLDEFSRAKTLQEIEDIMAVYQSRPASNVMIKDMDPQLYGYFDGNTIYINKAHVSNRDTKYVIDTILHEGRHSYQNYAISHPSVRSDLKQVNKWRKNFRHYLNPSIYGQEFYESQPVEADARTYAEKICLKIFGR
jgi:DNA repair exonuclease SbcCD ATPase subunit